MVLDAFVIIKAQDLKKKRKKEKKKKDGHQLMFGNVT